MKLYPSPDAQPVIVVQSILERRIKNAESLNNVTPPEHGRLTQIAKLKKAGIGPALCIIGLHDRSIFVEVIGISVESQTPGMCVEVLGHPAQRPWVVDVV